MEFHSYDWIPQLWLDFTSMTESHNCDWISRLWLDFTAMTGFHKHDWISHFQLNFTFSTEFHIFNWISHWHWTSGFYVIVNINFKIINWAHHQLLKIEHVPTLDRRLRSTKSRWSCHSWSGTPTNQKLHLKPNIWYQWHSWCWLLWLGSAKNMSRNPPSKWFNRRTWHSSIAITGCLPKGASWQFIRTSLTLTAPIDFLFSQQSHLIRCQELRRNDEQRRLLQKLSLQVGWRELWKELSIIVQ